MAYFIIEAVLLCFTPISILKITVPSAPLNLEYVNLTSTAIQVTWLPPADPNGIIDNYTLMLTFEADGTSENITDISITTHNVTGLLPYQEYTIVVYALTDKGPGSGSIPLNVLTDEDSKLAMILKVLSIDNSAKSIVTPIESIVTTATVGLNHDQLFLAL